MAEKQAEARDKLAGEFSFACHHSTERTVPSPIFVAALSASRSSFESILTLLRGPAFRAAGARSSPGRGSARKTAGFVINYSRIRQSGSIQMGNQSKRSMKPFVPTAVLILGGVRSLPSRLGWFRCDTLLGARLVGGGASKPATGEDCRHALGVCFN